MRERATRNIWVLMGSAAIVVLLAGCFGAGMPASQEPSLDDPHTVAIDQDNTSIVVSGGLGAPVVQSFVPQQSTSTGVDFRAHGTGSLEGDFRATVFASFDEDSNQLSNQIVTGEAIGVPRGTDAQVRWDPVAVNPGQTYYLEIKLTQGSLTVGAMTADGYPNGETLVGGGNLANAPDIYFRTYFADYE